MHLGAPGVETTGADHGAAPVAARAGEYHNVLPGWSPVEQAHARQVRQVPAGILRHLHEVDVQVLDHCPVYCDHLLGREKRHCLDAWEHRLARALAMAETKARPRGLAWIMRDWLRIAFQPPVLHRGLLQALLSSF